MEENGLCDDRDFDIHKDSEFKSMHAGNTFSDADTDPHVRVGEVCWIMFVAFDLIYIDGPTASGIIEETVSDFVKPRPSPGSLCNLCALERKKLLHRVVGKKLRLLQ